MDVKFLIIKNKSGKKLEDYQYTAIDDATGVRALKIYDRHTQRNAMAFVDHVIAKFPFRIQQIRTDRGHEFQAQFHWHVEDGGIRHAYIRPRTPQLNGKVERSRPISVCFLSEHGLTQPLAKTQLLHHPDLQFA